MSTQIIDNFKVNVAKPIDSRMVTSGTQSRDNLQFKYDGLRVYDINQNAPFVWISGAWQQESGSGSGGSISSGTTYRLLKYTGSSTIGDSAIVDKGSFGTPNIGIGKIPSSNYALDINGKMRVLTSVEATLFIGELNGSNISVKSLGIDKITPGGNNQVLKTTGSGISATVNWVADLNTNIEVNNSTTDATVNYLLFTNTIAESNSVFINNNTTKLIGVMPSTSQILGSSDATFNDWTKPAYSFFGTTNAGLYGNSNEVGLSLGGVSKVKINLTTTNITNSLIVAGGSTFSSTLAVNGATKLGGPLTVAGVTTLNGTLTVGTGSTTLNGTLTVAGVTTLNGNTSITGTKTLTVGTGSTTLGGMLLVSGYTSIQNQLVVNTSQSSEFAFFVNNSNGHGIQTVTNGEFFRSIQNTGINYNYMAFYKNSSTRRGYIGYGSSSGDSFIIANETTTSTGNIVFYTKSIERVNINNSNTTIKTPLIVESNVATAIDSGLIIKDSSTSNRGAFWMTPYLDVGQYNYTVDAGDFGLLFSSLGYNTKNGSKGFVIAPHTDIVEGGIRIDDTGRLEAHGGLTIGKKTSTLSHNGTIIERLITGRIEARIDGGAITGAIAGTTLINGVRVFDTSPKYSVNMIGSGLNGARVRITWTNAFLENNIFPIVTGVNGGGTAIYPALWDGTKLEVQTNGLASGTFTFNFIVLSISN